MYALYHVTPTPLGGQYRFEREQALFGCLSGLIPKLLRTVLTPGVQAPPEWHLPIGQILAADDSKCFIINLKPNNGDAAGSRSLYELLDVWGYSESGWTPAMLRLRGLVVDNEPSIADANDFEVAYSEANSVIYSFLYFAGCIEDGGLVGKWTAPRASPTNSALLWPAPLAYFMDQMQAGTPAAVPFAAT